MKIAIFASHPTQYQAPIFRALAVQTDVDVTVFFGSDHGVQSTYDSGFGRSVLWDVPLVGGYEHEFVANEAGRKDVNAFLGISVPRISERWAQEKFDAALILGWQTRGHIQAIRAARRAGIPTLLFGDSTLQMRPAAQWKADLRAAVWLPIRKELYSRLLKGIDGILTAGTRNEAYFRSFGISSDRMFRVGHGVENERFALSECDKIAARAAIRTQLHLGDSDFLIISIAKLQEKKRPLDLLEGFDLAARERSDMVLVYVGDGPQRGRLEAAVQQSAVRDRVRIAGFVNQEALPRWYAAADWMVLPSDSGETWGLAVNEALASGLPVIVSDTVGCAPDLIVDGVNGSIFPFADTLALSNKMLWAASLSGELREQMSVNAEASVAAFTPTRVAERIVDAARTIVARRASH